MTTTDVIATYAGALSSLTAIWQVYVGYRDKPKLKIKALYGRTHPGDVGPNVPMEEFIDVNVINCGRRPISVVSAGLTRSDGKEIIVESAKFPLQLAEGMSGDFVINMKLIHPLQSVRTWVRDANGKLHQSHSVDLVQLHDKALEMNII